MRDMLLIYNNTEFTTGIFFNLSMSFDIIENTIVGRKREYNSIRKIVPK